VRRSNGIGAEAYRVYREENSSVTRPEKVYLKKGGGNGLYLPGVVSVENSPLLSATYGSWASAKKKLISEEGKDSFPLGKEKKKLLGEHIDDKLKRSTQKTKPLKPYFGKVWGYLSLCIKGRGVEPLQGGSCPLPLRGRKTREGFFGI